MHLWRNQGPRINVKIGPGLFCFRAAPFQGGKQMNRKELAFTKQAILSTKDWDAYQVMMRKCLRIPVGNVKLKKKACKV